MKAGYPTTPLQTLFNDLLQKNQPKPKEVEAACIWYGKLIGQVQWFAAKAKLEEVDGMYEVRNEKGYTIAVFADQKPARHFIELINFCGGGGE